MDNLQCFCIFFDVSMLLKESSLSVNVDVGFVFV